MALIDGIVGLYHLNELWTDSSGNALDITNGGAVFDTVNKKLGSAAAKYDGLNDYGNIGDKSEFENDDFTIHAWCRRVNIGSYHTIACLQAQGAAGIHGPSGVILRFNSDNTISLLIIIGNAFEVFTTVATYTDTSGFYQIIAKKSGTGITIKVDNAVVKTGTTSSSTIDFATATSKRTSIGALWNGSVSAFGTFYDGQIDEAAIWDRATTNTEDTELWNGGAGLEIGVDGFNGFPFFFDGGHY